MGKLLAGKDHGSEKAGMIGARLVKCYKPGNWCQRSRLVWNWRCKSGPRSSYSARGKATKGGGNSHPWEGDLFILQLATAKEHFLKFSLEGSEFNPIQFGIGSAKS